MRVTGPANRWVLAIVAAAMVGACAGGTDDAVGSSSVPVTAGNAARFCAMWDDVRATLLGTVTGSTSFSLVGDDTVDLAKSMVSHDLVMEDADRAAPATIRPDWDVAYGAYTAASDLLFTINYSEAVLRPAHFAMAFGDAGYDVAVASAEAAVARIDDWAIDACYDFCGRWPEFEDIVRYDEHLDWGIWRENLDRYERALEVGDRLVPDAIADEWAIAVDIQRRRMTMFRESGFTLDVDEATALDRWGVIAPDAARERSEAALESVQTWADANCDATVATSGAPGPVSVRLAPQRDLTDKTLLAVLLPAGADFGTVDSLDPYLAAACFTPGDLPPDIRIEDLPSEVLHPVSGQGEYFSSDLCNLIQWEENAVASGGTHELFVGAFTGGPGAYGLYFGAPVLCTQITIGVDGRTVVDVPPLEPCSLAPKGRSEEIARRTAPPADGDSRLWIELPGAVARDGYDFCRLDLYLLPAGTTLNALGRGRAWPLGQVNFHQAAEIDAEGARLADQPGRVPMLMMPPSGTGEVMVFPHLQQGASWDTQMPEPVPLASGEYDLRVYEICADEGAEREDHRCGMTTVDVAGDTTLPIPDLGECP